MSTRFFQIVVVAMVATLVFTAMSCKTPAEKCAAVAKKCIGKAKDESLEELEKECQDELDKGRKWAKASVKCYDEVGDDCDKFKKCLRKKMKKK